MGSSNTPIGGAIVHTSYYASKLYDFNKMNVIAISQSVPKHLKGKIEIYHQLAPSWGLISAYKNGLITTSRFNELYHTTVLDKLNPEEVYQALGDNAVLLCWEAPGKFCHRHIVANWLNAHLNVNIAEL